MNWNSCIDQNHQGTCEYVGFYPYYCTASERDLTGFTYQNQEALAQSMIIIPIAIGALCLLTSGIQRLATAENRTNLCNAVISVLPSGEEPLYSYAHRIAPTALSILGAGSAISTAALLPANISPAIASLGATGIISLYLRGSEWLKKIVSYRRDIKELCQEWFAPKNSTAMESCRVIRNMGRVLAGLALSGVALWWGTELSSILKNSSTYDLALPGQSPAFIFLEYFLFVTAHLDQSFTYFLNGSSSLTRAYTWFHFLAAGITAALPFLYLHADLRIHHTLLGSAFMLLPFHSLKFLGMALLADGLNYRFNNSGFSTYFCDTNGNHFQEVFNPFGLDNVLADRFISLFSYTTVGCCLEQTATNIHKMILPPKPLPPLEEPLNAAIV